MTGYIGAAGIKQAFADAGWQFSERQIRHMIDTGRITVLRIGKRIATTAEDVRCDIERWRVGAAERSVT
jgi:hypothetical protein